MAPLEVVESLLFGDSSAGHDPGQPALPGPTGARALDKMFFRGPSQHQLFCDPLASAGTQSTDKAP